MMRGMARAVVAVAVWGGVLLGLARASVTVSVDGSVPQFVTDERYLSVNIDAASLYNGQATGALNFTFQPLQDAVRRMRPAVLRIGGSSADNLGFNLPTTTSSGNQILVDAEYWEQITAFAAGAGVDLVFDFNEANERTAGNAWNSSQAQAVLAYSRAHNISVWGWELGNEPGHFDKRHKSKAISASQLAADFVTLRGMLDSSMPDSQLLGIDVCFGDLFPVCGSSEWMGQVLQAMVNQSTATGKPFPLYGVTVHFYPVFTGLECSVKSFMAPAVLDRSNWALETWRDVVARTVPSFNATGKPYLVLGETATGGDGGCPGLSNAYVAGFFWVDQLARAARLNYSMVFRQDLVGYGGIGDPSNYALMADPGWSGNGSPPPPLTANPDFFTSLVWKKVMGRQSLATAVGQHVTSAANTTFRVYAHCHPHGGLSVAYVNLDITANVTFSVTVTAGDLSANGDRWEYHLSPPARNLTSRRVCLNGGPPLTVNSTLQPAKVPGSSPIVAAAATYGFVVFPNATLPACAPATHRP